MNPNLRRTHSKRRGVTAVVLACGIALLAAIAFTRRESAAARGQARAALHVTSSSFSNGDAIPPQYTCAGSDISPALEWGGSPAATRSFAVVMNDPDAPADFTHWLVFNIPATVRGLAQGASERGAMPQGSAEGTNSFGDTGYGGPCPPAGKAHHYLFHVYALDARLDLAQGATRDTVESAIGRHMIAEGQLVGVYRR